VRGLRRLRAGLPVEAIFSEDDVPAQWKEFTAANAAFFTEGKEPLGSPAGRPTLAPWCATSPFPEPPGPDS
jgi:hypothetical protein